MNALAVWIAGCLFTAGATDAPIGRYPFLVIAWPLFLGMAVRDGLRHRKSNPKVLPLAGLAASREQLVVGMSVLENK